MGVSEIRKDYVMYECLQYITLNRQNGEHHKCQLLVSLNSHCDEGMDVEVFTEAHTDIVRN